MDDRYIKQLREETYKAQEQTEKWYRENPLAQYSTSQLKVELRRRKGN